MPSQKHFYASQKDLKHALLRAEEAVSVTYVNGLLSSTPQLDQWQSLAEWKALGCCKNESPHSCGFFFVLPRHREVCVRTIKMDTGELRYKPHVSDNLDAIIFEPGGVFISSENNVRMIVGKIGTTATCSGAAEMLFKQFSQAFLRGFKRADGAYWAPEAFEEMNRAGPTKAR